MALTVFNTLTKRKQLFETRDPLVCRLYACGLTVYSDMHIGHARTYCFWDVFRRYLEYLGYHVLSVINYTDIDDRIMEQAGGERGWLDVAEEVIAGFRRDCRLLRIKDYAAYTRATDFIQGQIELTRTLLEKGHAYVVDGEVFYDVSSFPGYGKLSGRSVEEQQVGASGRVGEDFQRKRHPADFTLWKPTTADQPTWSTDQEAWPSGRPGWHIECSVMSSSLLGSQFDVHGGAVDNLFPHHENELAQSEPLSGEPWVRYWLHPEHLNLRDEKMSKSLGNVIGVPALLERHRYDQVRWFFSSHHYRTKLTFAHDLIESAAEGYAKIVKLLRILEQRLGERPADELRIPTPGTYASLRDEPVPRFRHYYTYGKFGEISARFLESFRQAFDDDLNTPQAVAAFFDYANELYAAGIEQSDDTASLLAVYRCVARHLYVLGCEFPNERLYPMLAEECFQEGLAEDPAAPYRALVDKLLALRQEARKARDFAKADLIRDLLSEAGLSIEDTPKGPRWSFEE